MNATEAIAKLLDYHTPLKVEDRADIASLLLKSVSIKPVEEKVSLSDDVISPVNCRQELKKKGLPYPRSSCNYCGSLLTPNWSCPFEKS